MYDKHLDIFLMVAEYGSLFKATEKIFISPNALIKQVNLLEAELGVTLFKRFSRGINLTDAGKSIYHDAKRIISLSRQAISKAKQIEQIEKNIRIGTSLLRPCKTIVNLWSSVSKNFPEIEL